MEICNCGSKLKHLPEKNSTQTAIMACCRTPLGRVGRVCARILVLPLAHHGLQALKFAYRKSSCQGMAIYSMLRKTRVVADPSTLSGAIGILRADKSEPMSLHKKVVIQVVDPEFHTSVLYQPLHCVCEGSEELRC